MRGPSGTGADDRKRGWPRLPWRPSELKWTHTLSRYACLERGGKRRRGRCHLYQHTVSLVSGRLRLSLPPSSSRPKAANGIMLNPRRGKFATRRRDVYPPLRAVSPSREKSWLVRDDGFVFSTVLRSGSMETFSFRGVEAVAEARYGSSNRNTVRRSTMLSRVNI